MKKCRRHESENTMKDISNEGTKERKNEMRGT